MGSESFRGNYGSEPTDYSHEAGFRQSSSSRMLENYLTDLEYLAQERLWTEALPLALALPHICISLSDPTLHSSREGFVAWCEQWLYPLFAESMTAPPTAEELFALSRERAGFSELEAPSGVPIAALKRLRLRRHARPAPPRHRSTLEEIPLETAEDPSHNLCMYIIHAVHYWYDDWAAFDSTVQTNLARLAVLR